MKTHFKLMVVLAFIGLHSCIGWGTDDVEGDIFTDFPYEPVIMLRSEFENSTTFFNVPRAIENSGKIYVKGDFIFVNEVNKGFHVINNADPSNPINIGFITVLGSSDLSIKDDVFYANNARDLIAFKINTSSGELMLTKRVANVFPQIWTPAGPMYYPVEPNQIIVDWQPLN